MSTEQSRVLSALIVAVAVMVAANMMAEPRYQSFAQENSQEQLIRGIFDTRTGRVCYAAIRRTVEGEGDEIVRCAPRPTP